MQIKQADCKMSTKKKTFFKKTFRNIFRHTNKNVKSRKSRL